MSDAQAPLQGPDFKQGVAESDVPASGTLLGHADGEAVLLVRRDAEWFAVGATCTHYSGPLADGIVVGDAVRCPYHHAAFSLRTGEAVRAPALNPIATWKLEREKGRVRVTGKADAASHRSFPGGPTAVVIVGAGAAGQVAVETLRREGYSGQVVLIGAEKHTPVDRPNLSKDYLAGSAPEEWMPLRPREWYAEHNVDLRVSSRAVSLDLAERRVALDSGSTVSYDKLILCTGAAPIVLPIPGAQLPHVRTLRTIDDSRAIIAQAHKGKRAVILGASFIGLEVAAALRARGVEVAVVGREKILFERVLGRELGDFVRTLHQEHGVTFHLGSEPEAIDAQGVSLRGGAKLPADLVVMGVGVRPALELATQAGLKVDEGIVVDAQLRTSNEHVFAAGDAARYPDPHTGEPTRIEHWVVAQRMGATAARNALGRHERYADAPFFWSQHYDVPIAYVGNGRGWDAVEVKGNIAGRDCTVSYSRGGKVVAVATIYRDQASLRAEEAWERGDAAGLKAIAQA